MSYPICHSGSMPKSRHKSASSLQRAWAKWPRSFPSFVRGLDRERILYLSHSRVAEFQRCPRCYYRRYIFGEKSESQAMLLGTLFHVAAARFYRAKRMPMPERLFARLALSKLDDDRHAPLRNAITLLCQNRHAGCDVVSVEEPFFLDLASGLPPIIGIADLVIRKGKSLAVIDHKTSRIFNDNDPAQLVLYAEHVGRMHHARVTEGIFDEYRLVPNLDRIRKPAFRRTQPRNPTWKGPMPPISWSFGQLRRGSRSFGQASRIRDLPCAMLRAWH